MLWDVVLWSGRRGARDVQRIRPRVASAALTRVDFTELVPADLIELNPDLPLEAPKGCRPLSTVTPLDTTGAPRPTEAPADEGEGEGEVPEGEAVVDQPAA
mgnify:CR=1 FL=1